MTKTYRIAVLAGDGIGPEVVQASHTVMRELESRFGFTCIWQPALVGGAAIDAVGVPLPQETLEICDKADAIFFGSVGGPKWDHLPHTQRPEVGALLPLRKRYGLYANLRPAQCVPAMSDLSPLRADISQKGFDLVVVRELTGGIYFGQPKGTDGDKAWDTEVYSRAEIERIAHVAFKLARTRKSHVTSIDKANVLASSRLWREVVEQVHEQYRDVTLDHMYIDNATMQLIRDPSHFDVIVTSNMFGDILSDECAMITGSIGMLPSASVAGGTFGLYEPSGGSAPDIAGMGIANPIAQLLSMAMMLELSFGEFKAASALRQAIQQTLTDGIVTGDLYREGRGRQRVNTLTMTQAILARLTD